jgi:hypothetical protein
MSYILKCLSIQFNKQQSRTVHDHGGKGTTLLLPLGKSLSQPILGYGDSQLESHINHIINPEDIAHCHTEIMLKLIPVLL